MYNMKEVTPKSGLLMYGIFVLASGTLAGEKTNKEQYCVVAKQMRI
jgi:hypothetical protein